MRISFWVSASVSLKTGMPVHIETMSAISSSPIAGRSPRLAGLPLLLELALLVRELALLVAQVRGLLELLASIAASFSRRVVSISSSSSR